MTPPLPETPASRPPASHAVTIAAYLELLTPRAWVTPTITALIVVGFVIEVARGASPVSPTVPQLLAAGANFGPAVAEGEWWRVPASLFVHAGLIHIAFNLWAFWNIGKYTERVFGNVAFLVVYCLSGFGGALASLAVHPLTVCVGASGAIFGVYGAMLAFVLRRDNRALLPASFLVAQRNSLLGFIGFNVVFGLAMPNVDLSAHGGGLLTGMAAGALLARDLTRPRDRLAWRVGGALLLTALLGVTAIAVGRRLEKVPEIQAERAANAALVHLKARELSSAIKLYTQALEGRRDAGWVSNRGLAYLWDGSFAKAQADFREANDLDPSPRTEALLCETQAWLAVSPDELEAADARCTAALASDGKNAALLQLRAGVRDTQHRGALAVLDATAAVALEPDSEGARRVRVTVLVGVHLEPAAAKEAEPDCAMLLARKEPSAFDECMCGRVAMANGDRAAARVRLEACLALTPSDMLALMLRGDLNEQEGRIAEGVADYRAVVAAMPDLKFVWNNLAWLEIAAGDFASARAHADHAVAEDPESAPNRGTRCFALVGLGALEEARVDCAKAVELDPGSAPDRGMLAFLDHRYDDARREWDAASADPVLARELAPWKARLPR